MRTRSFVAGAVASLMLLALSVSPPAFGAFHLEYVEGAEHGKGIVGTPPQTYHVPSQVQTQLTLPRPRATPVGKWAPILACESGGNWASTAGTFEGGLQHHPGTWDAYKPAGYPDAAYQATPSQQIAVAERVLAAQGWGAWPACARKAGYR